MFGCCICTRVCLKEGVVTLPCVVCVCGDEINGTILCSRVFPRDLYQSFLPLTH